MANTSNGLKIVYGAASFSSTLVETQPKDIEEFHALTKQILTLLEKEGIKTLDTAEGYPGSEAEIGYHGAADSFIIGTKTPGGFAAQPRSTEEIIAGGKASLEKLKTKQTDIFYFHAPETRLPILDQLTAANELYKQGAFKRLGLSNFTPDQVQEAYDVAKQNGFVLPTVYQGNYSAVARHSEATLFPTLRKLGIAFYAYSPIAGGFLAKTRKQIEEGAGRFDAKTRLGKLYNDLYLKPTILGALDTWNAIANELGITQAELAYRWIVHHSALRAENEDAVIFGAHSVQRIEETIGYLRKGPLAAEIVERIEGVWEAVKNEAPVDNFNK